MTMLPLYKLVRLSATGAIVAVPGIVKAILLTAGTANMTVALTDDATGAGTKVVEVSALANSCSFVDFTNVGGIAFSTAVYGTLAGTSAIAYIWVA